MYRGAGGGAPLAAEPETLSLRRAINGSRRHNFFVLAKRITIMLWSSHGRRPAWVAGR